MKEFRKDLKEEKFSDIVKQVNKEGKNLLKLRKDKKLAKTPEERNKIDTYIKTLERKVGMCLRAMTKDKANSASLSQLAKAFRVLVDKKDTATGKIGRVTEERKLSVSINVSDMSKDELLELLGKKSQEYEK